MPWLLNLAYLLLLVCASPILAWRAVTAGKYRAGWSQKLWGALPRRRDERPLAWFHAVSVGEVLQLEPLLAACRDRWPTLQILLSTTTATGHRLATERYPDCQVCWFPLDFSWSVRRALRRVRPSLVVLVEGELWPNFILATRNAGIPLALVNARLSESSLRGYRRIGWLLRRLLGCFDCIVAQGSVYADRLKELGAPDEITHVSGSIKFDRIETRRDNPNTQSLARELGIDDGQQVFIAGSTQNPEERLAVDAWLAARQKHPALRLVLVPRHPERFDEVAAMVVGWGLPLLRRSWRGREPGRQPGQPGEPPVVLLDTIGELGDCWGLADFAFVGGSLSDRGGQNMIEPAAYAAAVLFGPNTHNFQETVDDLLCCGGARVVADGESLAARLAWLLDNPASATAMGDAARRYVVSRQGATARTIAWLAPLVPLTPHAPHAPDAAAGIDVTPAAREPGSSAPRAA